MTKFVLHGGFNKERGPVQEDDAFFTEILKEVPENPKIILVYFAEREDIIADRIEQDKEQFDKNRGSRNLNFQIATRDNFIEECAGADVIYLHGGRTVKLMDSMRGYNGLKDAFANKTIAADSAGVNALGCAFYSKSTGEVGEGLKVLPYKFIVHHKDGPPTPLSEIMPDIETIFIREYETKIIFT